MDTFTHITTTPTTEEIVFPPVNDDSGTGSSGSCVVCKVDNDLPPVNEDSGTGSSGSCVVALRVGLTDAHLQNISNIDIKCTTFTA
ncbi:hypothetical protein C8R46DRAFT_1227667 [Mycena filopes]|nr:hypothetical protein C8R46DRAFT_1227667 [Mycena filopes]